MKKVLFTAAHSGFENQRVPLGGGAAICEHLRKEWDQSRPFELEVLGPDILGSAAPQDKALVQYSELGYARFCSAFEKRLTQTIGSYDPRTTVVLSNDISEGPDFKALAAAGYPIYTIFHVDVVDYFTKIYLRSKISPEATTAFYRRLLGLGISGIVPRVLKLIWDKQEACVRYSKGLIVPSERMKDVLVACYPDTDPGRIHVLPWGSWDNPADPKEVERERANLMSQYPSNEASWKLLTLSRIAPEKGQDLLLKALLLWEKETDFPAPGITLYLAGESAFMMGKKFTKALQKLAAKLEKTKIHFVGYAAGGRKKALFDIAELYAFPSRHESYGLTLMEALRHGKAVLSTSTHGARDVFNPAFGEMITEGPESETPGKILNALRMLWKDREELKAKGARAALWATSQDFSATAAKLSNLLASGN